MKRYIFLLITAAVISMTSCTRPAGQDRHNSPQRDYFQLKVFHFESAEQEALLERYFRDALLPALHRSGIKNTGVFKPVEGLQKKFIMVLIPFHSWQQFEELPSLLLADQAYQRSAEAYLDAPYDHPPYDRIESIILRSFTGSPRMALPELNTPRSERVYELRSYESATEKLHHLKVEMFNKGESELFRELKFNPVFFCEVLSSSHMPHLMYMTAHADSIAQKRNWEAFINHPEWQRMKNLDRYQHTVSSITKYLLYPTDYSDY